MKTTPYVVIAALLMGIFVIIEKGHTQSTVQAQQINSQAKFYIPAQTLSATTLKNLGLVKSKDGKSYTCNNPHVLGRFSEGVMVGCTKNPHFFKNAEQQAINEDNGSGGSGTAPSCEGNPCESSNCNDDQTCFSSWDHCTFSCFPESTQTDSPTQPQS